MGAGLRFPHAGRATSSEAAAWSWAVCRAQTEFPGKMGVERKREGEREGEREMGVNGWELPHVLASAPRGVASSFPPPACRCLQPPPSPQRSPDTGPIRDNDLV